MLESRPFRPAESDHAWSGYVPRSPEQTLLHRVVREQLEPFLARARARERPAPHFVYRALIAAAAALLGPSCGEEVTATASTPRTEESVWPASPTQIGPAARLVR